MTTADAVRRRLGLGRLLPLGEAADGAWLTEEAAVAVLRRAAVEIAGVEPGKVRLALADPARAGAPAVPAPPSALPPGPLRVEAEFAATADRPLPAVAATLREALFSAAIDTLGLAVREVDLRVTALVEPGETGRAGGAGEKVRGTPPPGVRPGETPGPNLPEAVAEGPSARVAAAATGVPGVARLTAALGAAVRLAPDHVRVELATSPGHHPPTVVRAVRSAVSAALPDGGPVAVVVTGVSG
ncbi:hypothetical protein [Streptomyces sp. NPDC001985]|uniref:hypothetical protein n=1 Tax=Streptomyces sp. NPDC001985 TaxID=3154406 RepID=UPI00332BC75B